MKLLMQHFLCIWHDSVSNETVEGSGLLALLYSRTGLIYLSF
jgi:hypothetical protein